MHNSGPPVSQHASVGYPYYYGSQATPSQQHQQQQQQHQYVVNADPSSRIGHAKVKRAPNSDCMLHDPAETLVVRSVKALFCYETVITKLRLTKL